MADGTQFQKYAYVNDRRPRENHKKRDKQNRRTLRRFRDDLFRETVLFVLHQPPTQKRAHNGYDEPTPIAKRNQRLHEKRQRCGRNDEKRGGHTACYRHIGRTSLVKNSSKKYLTVMSGESDMHDLV